MEFHIYRFKSSSAEFVVSDAAHAVDLTPARCGMPEDELEKIGVFPEMGEDRAAFDEGLAKRSIEHQGFYRFHSKTYDPVAQAPISMP
jgi:hypothetical protein